MLLFKPAQMFEANAPFFFFGLAQIALVLLPAFIVAFAALAWLASRGGQRLQHAAAALLGGLAAAAWVQATFVAAPPLPLDGRTLLVPFDDQRFTLNLLLWASVALGAAALAARFPRLAQRFFLALCALLALQAAWIAAAGTQPWRGEGDAHRLVGLSSEKNVLVVLLDAFQSDFFAEMVQREPELAQAFDGFTFFPNAVGTAPTTYLSIPAIHSGAPYREGDGLRETYRRGVVEGSFMAGLARSGYDAMLVNPILNYCPQGAACSHEGVLVNGRLQTLAESAAFLVGLAVFRIVPDAFKPAVYAETAWMTMRTLADERHLTSNRVLELMERSLRIESRRPVVRFLHHFGTHSPARVDANCRPVHSLLWGRQPAIAQDRCAVSRLIAVLRRVRDLGLYDRTAIVILADHGAGVPQDPKSGWTLGAFASPLLLVKPFGARAALARSARVVGLTDIAASVCAWTADCKAQSGADLALPASAPPKYPFFVYQWRHEYWFADSVSITERFEVRGPPQEAASWTRLQ